FPIAFWTVAVGAYVWAAAAPSESVAMVGKLANGAALVIALLTMFAGLFELRSITSGSQSMQVATWHIMVMSSAWVCFLAAMLLSTSTGLDYLAAQVGGLVSASVGFLLMGIGGWLGGRLVYEFGIGGKEPTKSQARQGTDDNSEAQRSISGRGQIRP